MVDLTIPIDLYVPDKTELAIVLQNELSTDFEEVKVEWVDCPDLTQEPFNLAAPGLCGDTALLDIGGIWNLFPFPIKDKIIYFQSILEKLDRTQSDNLIIGGGLRTERPTNLLGEDVYLNQWHVHANSNDSGGYYHETVPNNTNTEYLGYFSPATKLYRINPVSEFDEMRNFTCLRN
ncbi:PREDICTED: ester hydrolase C11orf54 homolog [Trachymyrmex septentrionalis]|uniref:ester hydrolase C11orf54 homolog n=1 Tax=Trachymyrmex septentrionalis TaxID=34720 RepID=UPI00084EF2F3|nr:PREDICTED: ester hydrolase C11orf54 homolog [Trachymyrmex septentrionalis]